MYKLFFWYFCKETVQINFVKCEIMPVVDCQIQNIFLEPSNNVGNHVTVEIPSTVVPLLICTMSQCR